MKKSSMTMTKPWPLQRTWDASGTPNDADAILQQASSELDRRFGIRHVTLQLESHNAAQRCVSGIDDCDPQSQRSSQASTQEG